MAQPPIGYESLVHLLAAVRLCEARTTESMAHEVWPMFRVAVREAMREELGAELRRAMKSDLVGVAVGYTVYLRSVAI